ncbi:hypothetical protein AAC387_Pa05g0913 [Persea americana]
MVAGVDLKKGKTRTTNVFPSCPHKPMPLGSRLEILIESLPIQIGSHITNVRTEPPSPEPSGRVPEGVPTPGGRTHTGGIVYTSGVYHGVLLNHAFVPHRVRTPPTLAISAAPRLI